MPYLTQNFHPERAAMPALLKMKRSLIAFVVVAALGLLSMGALGASLYYTAYPVLAPRYGDLNDWHGDWVWPAMIGVGMAWSVSFLAAGLVNQWLLRTGHTRIIRWPAYAVMLWIWAAGIWAVTLAGVDPGA